jgi:hypothetical protein
MRRRGVMVLLGIVLAATAAVAVANEGGQACPAGNWKVEKVDKGVRCTVTVKEGGDVAALRAKVRECCAKCGPEGSTVAFEEVEGGIVVIRTATDPAVVTAIQAMGEKCMGGKGCAKAHAEGSGKGCDKAHAEGAAGCPHHQKEAGKEAEHKGCPNHPSGSQT